MFSQTPLSLAQIKELVKNWERKLNPEQPSDKALSTLLRNVSANLEYCQPGDTQQLLATLNYLAKARVVVESRIPLFGPPPRDLTLKQYLQEQNKPFYHNVQEFRQDPSAAMAATSATTSTSSTATTTAAATSRPMPIDPKHTNEVVKLYAQLYEFVIKWNHRYALNAEGPQIQNQTTRDWQTEMMDEQIASQYSSDSYGDYKRNVRIDDKKGSSANTQEEIDAQLGALTARATSYPNETDQALLLEWLKSSRGGQRNNTFINQLLINSELGRSYTQLRVEGTLSDWQLKGGKLSLDMVMDFYLLTDLQTNELIAKTRDGVDIRIDMNPTAMQKLIEQFKSKELSPLLCIKATVTLGLQGAGAERRVVPMVTHLEIDSYTNALQKPSLANRPRPR